MPTSATVSWGRSSAHLSNLEVINEAKPPASTQILAYRGSIAHGTHDPDPESIDDIDLIGFVTGPVESYLGLQEWGSRGTKEVKRGRYDCVYYELRKAFRLLLAGNPNVLCTLWTEAPHVLLTTGAGKRILDSRDLFLGKHIYKPLAGYAAAQLARMESQDSGELRRYLCVTNEMKVRGIHPQHKGYKMRADPDIERLNDSDDSLREEYRRFIKRNTNLGYMGDKRKKLVLEHGYDAKNAAHCVRLLRMGYELFLYGRFYVYRKDADELREIKAGKWPLAEIKEHAEDLFANVKVARDQSDLPENPDREAAEKLLIDTLRAEIRPA